jgi:hypothetical protein
MTLMVKLLVISVTYHRPQIRVSDPNGTNWVPQCYSYKAPDICKVSSLHRCHYHRKWALPLAAFPATSCMPTLSHALLFSSAMSLYLRYVGVIWFLFDVLQLLPIIFTEQNPCWSSKSIETSLKEKPGWKSELPWFTHDYRKRMFVDLLIGCICPCNCGYYWW